MAYRLSVELHSLGVVVVNERNERELLIEGEQCCGVGFDELKRAAAASRSIEVDDACGATCRLGRIRPYLLAA
jgi:hypothetical protein